VTKGTQKGRTEEKRCWKVPECKMGSTEGLQTGVHEVDNWDVQRIAEGEGLDSEGIGPIWREK
jgi:hypothetical protein